MQYNTSKLYSCFLQLVHKLHLHLLRETKLVRVRLVLNHVLIISENTLYDRLPRSRAHDLINRALVEKLEKEKTEKKETKTRYTGKREEKHVVLYLDI